MTRTIGRYARVGSMIALMALATSCGGGTPPPPVRTTTPPPTSPPAPANGVAADLAVGHIHLTTTGAVHRIFDADLAGASKDPAVTIMSWVQGIDSAQILAGPGVIARGEHRSSVDLSFELRLTSVDREFLSQDGGCTISFGEVGSAGLRGTVRCRGLMSRRGGAVIGVTGTFSAGPH